MTDTYSVRHADQRTSTNTDQAELSAMLNGTAVPDAGLIDEQLSGELADLETADIAMEPWQKFDVQTEDEVSAIQSEIDRRKRIMGPAYPFQITGSKIEYIPSKSRFYEYCLAVCTAPSISRGQYVQLPRSFERFSCIVVEKHLGPDWKSKHVGFPRDGDNETTFQSMCHAISTQSSNGREWTWNPLDSRPPDPKIGGDGGLDFIVWRPSPDDRIGQIYVAGQCACGNDWESKFNDLDTKALEAWMRPVTVVPIVRCFATPFVISDGNFEVAHAAAGWVLDRCRLTMMAEALATGGALQLDTQHLISLSQSDQ